MSLTQAIGPRTCQVTETQVKIKFYNNNLLSYTLYSFLNMIYPIGDVTMQ